MSPSAYVFYMWKVNTTKKEDIMDGWQVANIE